MSKTYVKSGQWYFVLELCLLVVISSSILL